MSDRELLRETFEIMRNLLLIPYGDCGQIAPRKGTTRRECYRALYEIQELIGSRQLFPPKQTNGDHIRMMSDEELAKELELIDDTACTFNRPRTYEGWLEWLRKVRVL